jgi:hypothetical protein
MHKPANVGSFEEWGAIQANEFIEQWKTYNEEGIIAGRTLFADVESRIQIPDTSGWEICWDPYIPRHPDWNPEACAKNQRILNGFLQEVAARGFTPGVYTSAESWVRFFGWEYKPTASSAQIGDLPGKPQPFVLWTSGCNITQGVDPEPWRKSDAIKAQGAPYVVMQTILGGAGTVIWQYHINKPDYDVMFQNPSSGFSPRKSSSDYTCTCQKCPDFE